MDWHGHEEVLSLGEMPYVKKENVEKLFKKQRKTKKNEENMENGG